MANLDTNTLFSEETNLTLYKKKHSHSTKTFIETDIIKMLELLIDNIFIMFGGCGF